MWQAIYYVGSFLLAWIFPTVLRIHELTAPEVYYHWVLLSALFVPTQGLWDFLVYMRPRYLKVVRKREQRRQRLEQRHAAAATGRDSIINQDGSQTLGPSCAVVDNEDHERQA